MCIRKYKILYNTLIGTKKVEKVRVNRLEYFREAFHTSNIWCYNRKKISIVK